MVANPIEHPLDPDLHDKVLTESLEAAAREGIRGKDVTPYLLDRFHRETDGASLEANVRLVMRNAALAGTDRPRHGMTLVVLGDLMVDVIARAQGPLARGSDTPASVSLQGGGSGANVAAWAAALGTPVGFACRVGDDVPGRRRG